MHSTLAVLLLAACPLPAAAGGAWSAGGLPLSFERSDGQAAPDVRFTARSGHHTLALTSRAEVRLDSGLSLRPVGGRRAAVLEQREPLPARTHYFLGNDPSEWRPSVPHFGQVCYRGVYPGIDLVYYGNRQALEFDFVVAPGAEPGQIRIRTAGHQSIRVDPSGALVVNYRGGELRQPRPAAYQEIGGRKVAVQSGFVLIDRQDFGFRVGAYDRRYPLVIDPVLVYSTYLGGSGAESVNATAVDSQGNVYITGKTTSAALPSAQPLETPSPRKADVYVAKISADGARLLYSVYLGGSDDDEATALTVDAAGNVYLAGTTKSTNFPITANAFQKTNRSYDGGFVAKIDPTGSRLVFSTYFCGSRRDNPTGIGLDAAGNVYVAGDTSSDDFPVVNSIQKHVTNHSVFLNIDGFVSKLDPTGSRLIYSTYFGGTDDEHLNSLAVDPAGSAYIAGSTLSNDFPVVNAFQTNNRSGNGNAFVAKINPAGSALVFSTYLGGSYGDGANAIALDAAGSAYVTGQTNSPDFPLAHPFQADKSSSNGSTFVTKISSSGALVYSTYLASEWVDGGNAIAVDATGSAFVAGSSWSQKFPQLNPVQPEHGGGFYDAFVARLSPEGSSLLFSTYLGGNGDDSAEAVALDRSGNVVVAGLTRSPDFPVTAGVLQTRFGGSPVTDNQEGDAFIARIDLSQLPPQNPAIAGFSIHAVAGLGVSGPAGDGLPAAATYLGSVSSVAIDPGGSLLIAHRYCGGGSYSPGTGVVTPGGCGPGIIRRLNADGTLLTIAGLRSGPSFSGDGGPAAKATFDYPVNMLFDGSGNLIIPDANNNRVRRIAPDGTVSTIAGTGDAGNSGDGGPALSARFNAPVDVAFDSAGNMYVADYNNRRIRKVARNGTVSTVVGTGDRPGGARIGDGGPAIQAQIETPVSVAVDSSDNLYIAEYNRIRKVTPQGTISTFAGTGEIGGFNGDDRPANTAKLWAPRALIFDRAGNLYFADRYNHRVRRISPGGMITTVAGSGSVGILAGGLRGDYGPAAAARLKEPLDLAFDGDGNLYVVDSGNGVVRKLGAPREAPLAGAVAHGANAKAQSGIPRGGFFTVFGSNLGPAQPLQTPGFPISAWLGDVAITLSQGGKTWNPLPIYVSAGQINAILPSDAPLGDAALAVSFSGFTGKTVPIRVADAAFEIFPAGTGDPPRGILQNVLSATDLPLNSPAQPAKPGQTVIAWGSGLGPLRAPDYLPAPAGDLPGEVEVRVGGKLAKVAYHGRAPGLAGVDVVYFEVPADAPPGCQVPLQVRAANSDSLVVTMAISPGGGPCQ